MQRNQIFTQVVMVLACFSACSAEHDAPLDDIDERPQLLTGDVTVDAPPEDDGSHVERTLPCPVEEPSATESFYPGLDMYYPDVIDAELTAYPELAEAIGTITVETCDQARAWSRNRLALVAGEPESVSSPNDAEEDTSDDRVIDKIWQGVNHIDDSIIFIEGLCSSVAITRYHVLTAAHCVPVNDTTCNGYPCNTGVTMSFSRATSGGTKVGIGTWTSVTTYKHESYGGASDAEDDIALVVIDSLPALPASPLRSIQVSPPIASYSFAGWGSTSQYSPGNAGDTLRRPSADGTFAVDWWPPSFLYSLDDNDNDVDVCRGDSGAPSWSSLGVVGLGSNFDSSGSLCRTGNQKERWTTVYTKLGWIEPRLRNSAGYLCPAPAPQCCTRNSAGTSATCY